MEFKNISQSHESILNDFSKEILNSLRKQWIENPECRTTDLENKINTLRESVESIENKIKGK